MCNLVNTNIDNSINELITVDPAICVNGNDITSKNLSDIENNKEDMLNLI